MNTTTVIKSVSAKRDDPPALLEPTPGRWYCGMSCHDSTQDHPGGWVESGELMRYDGDNCWTNEDEDPDGCAPRPESYDYLQEQV